MKRFIRECNQDWREVAAKFARSNPVAYLFIEEGCEAKFYLNGDEGVNWMQANLGRIPLYTRPSLLARIRQFFAREVK